MNNVMDYAKWFIDNNLDTPRNNFKGNMKLQKLLFFAQLISLAKNDKLLFEDNFYAFENGMVVEDVRIAYKDHLCDLLKYEAKELPSEDIEILQITKDIYGNEDADELSKMSHEFTYWKKYFERSRNRNNYKEKKLARVPNSELKKELDNIRDVLYVYETMNTNVNPDEDFDY